MKYLAHYSANNDYEEFDTFEKAEDWLNEQWTEDGTDDGYAEESISGGDFIAKITHTSKYVEIGNKEKDGYVWDEEAQISINSDGEEWAVSEEFDSYGKIVLEELKSEMKGKGL